MDAFRVLMAGRRLGMARFPLIAMACLMLVQLTLVTLLGGGPREVQALQLTFSIGLPRAGNPFSSDDNGQRDNRNNNNNNQWGGRGSNHGFDNRQNSGPNNGNNNRNSPFGGGGRTDNGNGRNNDASSQPNSKNNGGYNQPTNNRKNGNGRGMTIIQIGAASNTTLDDIGRMAGIS